MRRFPESSGAMAGFAAQHLDPGSHMGEALFGLIMTLTFTLGADLVIQEQGREVPGRC